MSPVGEGLLHFTVFTNVSTQLYPARYGALGDFKFHEGEASWKEAELSAPE